MRPLSIGVRLTAWYSLVLALSLGVFGSVAYLAMSHSIRSPRDSGSPMARPRGQALRANFWNVWQFAGTRPRLTANVQVTSAT